MLTGVISGIHMVVNFIASLLPLAVAAAGLVAAFRRGESPEAIQDDYDAVSLADVYAILAYYLRHRQEVDAYIAEQAREGAEVRARIEQLHPMPEGLRAKLLARLEQ